MLKKVPGTKDILPEEIKRWQIIQEKSAKIFSLYGYAEIRTPLIEEAALFNRSLGDTTEVVKKQMFQIQRQGDIYALRPEATAGIARAYIENNLDKKEDFSKFYYIGAMFRAERPQKGRLRQFHHIGCEAIGSDSPYLDAEIILLAEQILKELHISGYQIKLNSLGCVTDKKRLIDILKEELGAKLSKLCPECQNRFTYNVLRILYCKVNACRKIVADLKLSQKYLCLECANHFQQVRDTLDALGLNYKVVPYLVRGLDYYTRTVFEISHSDLGSQDALAAGGRYDNLIQQLGGPHKPAIGFAFGLERLLLVEKEISAQKPVRKNAYFITLGERAKKEGFLLLAKLRKAGIAADIDLLS